MIGWVIVFGIALWMTGAAILGYRRDRKVLRIVERFPELRAAILALDGAKPGALSVKLTTDP